MFFKNICVLALRTKVASALEGIKSPRVPCLWMGFISFIVQEFCEFLPNLLPILTGIENLSCITFFVFIKND